MGSRTNRQGWAVYTPIALDCTTNHYTQKLSPRLYVSASNVANCVLSLTLVGVDAHVNHSDHLYNLPRSPIYGDRLAQVSCATMLIYVGLPVPSWHPHYGCSAPLLILWQEVFYEQIYTHIRSLICAR